jgi:hypothetical protein
VKIPFESSSANCPAVAPLLHRSALAVAATALFCLPMAVLADTVPLTGEIKLADNSTSQAIARNASGDTVIAWQTFTNNPSATLTYAQLFDAAGNSRGAPILVNSATDFAGPEQVAMDAAGDFVVTWAEGAMPTNWSNASGAVYAQRFSADGTAQGSAINVGSIWLNRGVVGTPAVAMDTTGDFVVTWADNKLLFQIQGTPLWTSSKVYSRLFAADGTPKTSAFVVDTLLGHSLMAQFADVAMDATGEFAVTWTNYQHPNQLASDVAKTIWVYAQRYNSSGKAQGAHILVQKYDNSTNSVPGTPGQAHIAMDPQGDFGISWNLVASTVTAQVYAANGSVKAGPINVVTLDTTTPYPLALKGSMDNVGNFLVPWAVVGSATATPIYGQYYGLDGTPIGSNVAFSTDTAFGLFAVAVDGQGNPAAAWDDVHFAIQAQFFTGP